MFVISREFTTFLSALSSEKKNEGLAFWQNDIRFLTVILDGVNDWNDCLIGGMIMPGMDIIVHMRECDRCIGFQYWYGADWLMSRWYTRNLTPSQYERFYLAHNKNSSSIAVSEVLDALAWDRDRDSGSEEMRERWGTYEPVLRERIKRLNPTVHIPLFPSA